MQIFKTLSRIFITPSEMDQSIDFYQKMFKETCSLRFDYSEKGLELAMVGCVLLIAGSNKHLEPFTQTKVTFLVDSVDEWMEFCQHHQSTILDYPKTVPSGKNMRVRHPDGLIAEYVEHF
ncbi:MAG: hypothetical protein CENE_01889 [Candidatus Celerinatantimonas neptuna]|nr:MAG: hypothetical protein CENE_01889 [Candidatus Celerinatantimonas neptuna]